MTFWLIVGAVALVLSILGVMMLAATPSTERVANSEIYWVVAICFVAVFLVGLVIKGVMSLFGVA
jgi:hypothetical protein